MTKKEKLVLGRMCGCEQCKYCKEVQMEALSRAIEALLEPKQKRDGKEYKHKWQKSK